MQSALELAGRGLGYVEPNPAGARLYVTLEPCSHTGKTATCTQGVIEVGIVQVVIAAGDPTDLAGSGIH